MIDQQFVGRTWCQHWPLPRMMEGGVLCLLVALRPRLELRYQPVTLPKLNVVPTTNFFPASQAWASSAHSKSKQLWKCASCPRCRRDIRACTAIMARVKPYHPYIVARPPVCAVLQWLFGGYSSLFNQPVASSVFMGSGFSHSKHRNFPCPLPPGGNARIKKPRIRGK